MIRDDGQGGALIDVKVVPGARRDEVAGVMAMPGGDRLKVRVSAPAEGGKANKAVCRLIASALGVRPAAVRLVSGTTSPEKTVGVGGVPAREARGRLGV